VQAASGLPLWYVGDHPGAVMMRHGRGRVLVVADPSLVAAAGLQRQDSDGTLSDNVIFLYNVAALYAEDGQVYFDEYHHGLRTGGGFWGYLRYRDQQWTVLLVVLCVAVAVWGVAVRLGPAVPTAHAGRADAVDYASAVARIYEIYERAGVQGLLARALIRGFLGALTRHLHLRRNALPAEILAAWQQRYPEGGPVVKTVLPGSGQQLQQLLRGVGELRRGQSTPRQLLHWAQAFDHFQAKL
jgi:hypothetical protein